MNRTDLDNIKIVSMASEDLNDVLEIHFECGLSPWTLLDYQKEIENKDSLNFVAKQNEKIIGFAIVRMHLGAENVYDSAEIYNIAVSNSFQTKGIGQKLFDRIVSKLKTENISEIWLDVRESNKKAIKFYLKNGFVQEFVRKDYYNHPLENAFILKLTLKNI